MNTPGQPGIVQCRRNQVTFVYILCTGNNLDGFFLTDIHLTDKHMIRVGVGSHADHLTDHNIFDIGIHALIGFHLLTEDSQRFHKFLIGNVGQIHEFLIQPFSVELHCIIPPY